MSKYATASLHLVLFALVIAIGAYWAVRIFTPQPIAAPPPLTAPPPREPDPIAAARMFGLIQVAAAVVSNIQVAGIFAAGKDSSAILAVDGKPPRAFVLGQEVTPGTTLVAVKTESVILERGSGGGRQELQAPSRQPSAPLSTQAPGAIAPAYKRQGKTLSADAPMGSAPATSNNLAPQPSFQPPPPAVVDPPVQQEPPPEQLSESTQQ